MKNLKLRKMATIGIISALALLVTVLIRIPLMPAAPFLKYDPKDVIVVICGFIFGPLSSFCVAAIVSLLEMVTVSESGIIGCIMNLRACTAFTCTSALVYKKRRTMTGAIVGLLSGGAAMTGIMLLWNYLVTPLYMGYPRAAVAAMLIPVFLPFNLIKSGLNAGITLMVYRPLIGALQRANLLEDPETAGQGGKVGGMVLIGLIVAATCTLCVLVLQGIM